MEEKILAKLDEMNQNFDQKLDEVNQKFDKKLDEVNQKFDKKLDEMNQKFDKKFDEMDQKFDKLRNEMDENFTNMKTELSSQIKREVLDQMFVFETEYGRKINIMYEELTGKIQKERNLQEDIAILEKRVDKNTAFVFSHENLIKGHERRITTLEKSGK